MSDTSYGQPVEKLGLFDLLYEASRFADGTSLHTPEARIAMRERLRSLAHILAAFENDNALAHAVGSPLAA